MLSYTVTSQHQTSWLDPSGAFVDGVEITFTVPGHGSQSVKVPLDIYNADRVKSLIEDRVSHITAIAQLGTPRQRI
jgi:hypothetical protein